MKKTKKQKMVLSPEELKRLKEINEKQRIRNEYIKKRTSEIDFTNGIMADKNDFIGIKRLQFFLNLVNFFGNTLQNIQNFFNNRFIKEKNSFWYKNIYKKYDIPKEIPLTYIKQEDGKYKFMIHKENDK